MGIKVELEVSRIDCRLFDDGILRHFCILDRVDIDTLMIVGITFPITGGMRDEVISYALDLGFRFLKWERVGPAGGCNRVVTYDMINGRFLLVEKI